MTVFLSEHDFLVHAVLYLFVEMRIGHVQHQPVGPALACHADFSDDRLVVESIIETLYMLDVAFVAEGRIVFVVELLHPVVNVVIVVRIILVCIDFIRQSVLETLSEIDIRFVGIERTVGIRGVQEPVPSLFVGHDVDDPSQGIGSEAYGYHSLVHLNTFGKVHRNVVQVECGSGPLLWYAVDEHLHVLAAEAVEHQLHVRTHAARFTQFHSRKFLERLTQVLGGVLQFLGIYGHCIES